MTAKIFDFIPPFAKDKKSGLLAKLSKENSKTADRNVWASQEAKREVEASVATTQKAQKTEAAAAEPAPVEDSLIDLGDGQPAGVDPAVTALISKNYRNLLVKNSGVLFENEFLQIGIKAQFQAHQGRVTLFLGNKSTAVLDACEFALGSVDGLKLQL